MYKRQLPEEAARLALSCLDEAIVDIKDANPRIYRAYTGKGNARTLANLRLALDTLGPERVLVRVPRIPGFNTEKDVEKTIAALRDMGATRLDAFTYRTVSYTHLAMP